MDKRSSNFFTIVGLIIILFLISNVLSVNRVQAATCKTVSEAVNDSIYDACRWGGARGTLWISDSKKSTDVTSRVKVSGWESGDGKVTAYLHGAIIGGKTAFASHIKLIKSNSVIDGLSEANKHSAYSVFSGVPGHMKRPGNSRTGKIKSNIDPISLDVKKLRKLEKPKSTSNGKEVYKVPIQGFRCYSTNGSNVIGRCYSSKSTLTVEVKLKKVKLTVVSKDVNGKSLSSKTGLGKQVSKVYYGQNTSIKRGTNSDYEFMGWKIKYNSSTKKCTGGYFTTVDNKKKTRERYVSGTKKPYGRYHRRNLEKNEVVCAVYKAKTKPCVGSGCNPVPHTGDLTVDARNRYTADFAEYTSKVYAKPTDKIDFRITYKPTAQSNYNSKVDVVKLNGTQIKEGSNIVVGSAFSDWENQYSFGSLWSSSGLINVGNGNSSIEKREKNDAFEVRQTHVGNDLVESAKVTNKTPRQVSISSDKKTANIITTPVLKDEAHVVVPYNFETDVKMTDGGGVVFAGESTSVKAEFSIKGKENSLTTKNEDETYATKVDDAIRKKIVYSSLDDVSFDLDDDDESEVYTGGRGNILCGFLDHNGFCEEENEEWNSSNGGEQTEAKQMNIDVPDVNAGTYICVAVAVFPSSSGSDSNISTSGYTNEWKLSNSKCFVVAKKPSVQVWGGNVFSKGLIRTALAEKATINNYDGIKRAFGSWGELGVISNSGTSGFGSGASLGYESIDNNGRVWPFYHPDGASGNVDSGKLPGGGEGDNYCQFIPLTFPNEKCGSLSFGGLSISGFAGGSDYSSDKSAIISKLIPNDKEGVAESFDECLNGDETYCYTDEDVYLPKSTVGADKGVIVLHSGGNISIGENLEYEDNMGYETFSKIPKLVVYAKNIYIDCEVDRIDALLVADESVKTCADEKGDEPEILSGSRSNQLRINGAVITNSISLGRTYGAATGANSIIPAEIINFDPSLYLWAKDAEIGANGDYNEGSESISSGLVMSFTHELAPRK